MPILLSLDPFGYDKNDLVSDSLGVFACQLMPTKNLDHFTNNIIRERSAIIHHATRLNAVLLTGNELWAVTSAPPPDPADWAFSPENDLLFSSSYETDQRVTPEAWMRRDYNSMLDALHVSEIGRAHV